MTRCSRCCEVSRTSCATSSSCLATRRTTRCSPSWQASTASGPATTRSLGSAASAVALFEPLVRATGRDGDALARIASLMDQLREMPNGDELMPDGFDQLWTVVWQVHRERLS